MCFFVDNRSFSSRHVLQVQKPRDKEQEDFINVTVAQAKATHNKIVYPLLGLTRKQAPEGNTAKTRELAHTSSYQRQLLFFPLPFSYPLENHLFTSVYSLAITFAFSRDFHGITYWPENDNGFPPQESKSSTYQLLETALFN